MIEVESEKLFKPSEINFPCLMSCIEDMKEGEELIVLFDSHTTGMVVQSNVVDYTIGKYVSNWHLKYFVPYEGTIKIRNKREM